jgi:acyl dehydratase
MEERTMLVVERPAGMKAHIGEDLGASEWVLVDQTMIDKFADATGDHQWIHVDVERAKREMPNGKTIAHGFLTLSLLPRLGATVYRIRRTSRGINYGSNKVRFTAPVPAGSRVRLHQVLKAVDDISGGVRLTFDSTVEIEGSDKPALVAETLSLAFD